MKLEISNSIAVALRALRGNPIRTLLSTLGIVVGVASLLAILNLSDGLEMFVREQLERTTDIQTIVVTSKTADEIDGIVVNRSNPIILSHEFVDALADEVGSSASVSLALTSSQWISLSGDSVKCASLVSAVLPNAIQALGQHILAGRFVQDSDISNEAGVVVISNQLALKMAKQADPHRLLEQIVRVGTQPYQIVGILTQPEKDRISRAYVPLTASYVLQSSKEGGKLPVVVVKTGRLEEVDTVRANVERFCRKRFGNNQQEVLITSSIQRLVQMKQAMFVFKLAMGFISGISLIVGGIGIMNILLASVSERTREIGIRRASGARRMDILLQFLAEAVIISGVGGVMGIILGFLGSLGIVVMIRNLTDAPLKPVFTWAPILVSFAAAFVVGLIFGIYPAFRAGKLSPTDAIRYE